MNDKIFSALETLAARLEDAGDRDLLESCVAGLKYSQAYQDAEYGILVKTIERLTEENEKLALIIALGEEDQ
jgi:hypothetical protein